MRTGTRAGAHRAAAVDRRRADRTAAGQGGAIIDRNRRARVGPVVSQSAGIDRGRTGVAAVARQSRRARAALGDAAARAGDGAGVSRVGVVSTEGQGVGVQSHRAAAARECGHRLGSAERQLATVDRQRRRSVEASRRTQGRRAAAHRHRSRAQARIDRAALQRIGRGGQRSGAAAQGAARHGERADCVIECRHAQRASA